MASSSATTAAGAAAATTAAAAAARIEVSAATDALLIVDMQKDFLLPGAPLLVSGGAALLPGINALSSGLRFRCQVAAQDWHPANHCSFAVNGGVWPVHCVQGSTGAELHDDLATHGVNVITRKGVTQGADSYSAFVDDNGTSTGLAGLLKAVGVRRVLVCGVASDFCAFFTAMDARKNGFEVVFVEDLTAAVNAASWAEKAATLAAAGVTIVKRAALTNEQASTPQGEPTPAREASRKTSSASPSSSLPCATYLSAHL